MATRETVRIMYPADDESFELTLDGDAHDPIEMVRRDHYSKPEKWQHTGKRVRGTETRRFKLMSVGYQRNFKAVCEALEEYGEIPEGQWREAFKAAYPEPDGKGLIGIADSSWVANDLVVFPCVDVDGRSRFGSTYDDFSAHWRWLVEVSK